MIGIRIKNKECVTSDIDDVCGGVIKSVTGDTPGSVEVRPEDECREMRRASPGVDRDVSQTRASPTMDWNVPHAS